MRILAVDTSSVRGSVAVRDAGSILGEVHLTSAMQQAERLFRSVDFLFEYVGFPLADVDAFVAIRGPGSFTGLRVGLAAVQGFAAAFGKPATGISSLRAWAWQAGVATGRISVSVDARRDEIYAAMFERRGDELTELVPPCLTTTSEWLRQLEAVPTIFVGDAAERDRAEIERAGFAVAFSGGYLAAPASEMVERGWEESIAPLYIRSADAKPSRERIP